MSASLTWRFLGPVTQDNDSQQPGLAGAVFAAFDYFNYRIPGYNYIDLEATWDVNKVLQIRAGANNVLDKDPPTIDTANTGGNTNYAESNTYPSLYDVAGRYVYANLTIDF